MKRILAVVLFALSAAAFAQTSTPTLTGKWTAKWVEPKGGLPNKVTLVDDAALTGTYTADNGEACPVSGLRDGGNINLTVQCTKFRITMVGSLSHSMGKVDDNEIDGTYSYFYENGSSKGTFEMDKDSCWLLEGCK